MRAAALAPLSLLFLTSTAAAAPTVWAIDDGEKIKEDATSLPLETGAGNPVWSPGKPIELFALRNETIAFQIIVEADAAGLDGVTVDLDALSGPNGSTLANAAGATDPTSYAGRPIERFVEHFFTVARASGGNAAGVSLGWNAGAAPPSGQWTGAMPDALIPVEVAPPWSPYPMQVAPNKNGAVWIDVTVPSAQAPGAYAGNVVVKAGAAVIATLPVELEVLDVLLADRVIKTMLYYDRSELDRRIAGGDAVEQQYWQLLHRHRLAPLHDATSVADVKRHMHALDGTSFAAAAGYDGPAIGIGDGVLSIGAYGALGAPSPQNLALVEQVADALATAGVLASTDVFVYAIDETCSSPYGKDWKTLLATSKDPNVKSVRVAWTCSDDPTTQPVDIPIELDTFDVAKTAAARAMGKEVWVYNGVRPMDGAFLTDTEAVSLRANGWIGGMMDIGRWFYWETTFWYDDNKGGKGAYDPFVTPETFHNADGDYSAGDGVLVYPGKQVDVFTQHSVGMNGVIASIRLKNWRRGIEDAGYYQLARAANRAAADAIATGLIPAPMSAAVRGGAPSWPAAGKPFFDARKALLALIPQGPDAGAVSPVGPSSPGPSPSAAPSSSSSGGCGCRHGCARGASANGGLPAVVLAGCIIVRRRRSRRAAAGRRAQGDLRAPR